MNKGLVLSIPLILVAGLFILFATQIGRDTNLVPSVLINKPVPEFSLEPIANIPGDIPGFATADLTGGVSVVNVFASWCIPCRDEHPILSQVAELEGVTLFGINQKDAPEDALKFLSDLGNPFDAIGTDPRGRASLEWGIYGVPETFVVNDAGIITYKFIGPLSERTYFEDLLPAINAARTSSDADG